MSDLDDIVVDITRRQESARAQAIGGFDITADQAARSVELGRSMGQNPNIIAADVDNFDEAYKRNMATAIIRQNLHLADYANGNPINAKLSQDDWGTLDKVSGNLQSFRRFTAAPTRTAEGIVGAAARGFMEGVGQGTIGDWTASDPALKDNRFAQATWGVAASPVEVAFRLIAGAARGATEGLREGSREVYQTFTGDASGADKFSKDMAGMLQMQLDSNQVFGIRRPTAGQVAEGHLAKFDKDPAGYLAEANKAEAQLADKAWKEYQQVKLWLDEGVEPPAGLSKDVDRIKREQNSADVANLNEMLSDAQRSTTRERDPDTFADFIRMRDDATISVDADAVIRLYGDKPPHPEDGLMGWSPEIASQLEVARRAGGDIEIPLADWLARVDPEIAKALADDIRVRPGGITKSEARGLSEAQKELDTAFPKIEGPEAPLDTPRMDPAAREILPDTLPQLRAAGGLEPMFSIGDRQLTLKKAVGDPRLAKSGVFKAEEFSLLDETGRRVGWLEITPFNGGRRLYVDNIMGFESQGMGPNAFGPSLTRSILRQLKEQYPEAKEIGGFRISGAREKAGSEKEQWIKFDADSLETARQFRDGLAAKWQAEGGGVESLRRKLTGKEAALEAALAEEATKIAPGLNVELVSAIFHPDATGVTKGVYLGAKTLVSLEAGNPAGVLRHEAIHHLYRANFFTDAEWTNLERTAREEGWIQRYNIDKRYPDLNNAARLEEAIAEGYNYWKSGEEILKDAGPFQKLKDFFDALLRRFKEILGEDFTWEELFKEVDAGRVGRRVEEQPQGRMEPAFSQDVDPTAQPSPRDTFRTPAAVGMSEAQVRLYERRLAEMHEQDVEWSTAKAEREQRRRLTREWKQAEKETRSEVEATMMDRPDVAADLFFARGEYFGNKIAEKVKIDPESLTPEQRAGLPKDYLREGGLSPRELQDVATGFGFHTTAALLDSLTKWNAAKLGANMGTKAFLKRMVDIEVERQMAGKLGDLEQSILDHAKDQVAGETQLNLIAEETLALGIRAGKVKDGDALPINKAEYKQWFADQFGDMPLAGQTSDKYLRAMQKSGTAAEMELLRGNFDGAYRAKQQQFGSLLLFKDARALEKERTAFDKLTKKLAKRDVAGLDHATQDVLQSLMWEAGIASRRTMPEIQSSQANHGYYLPEWYLEKMGDGLSPAVPDYIVAGQVKPLDQMTVKEFRDFADAIKSINYVGRQVEKINVAGVKQDLKEWKADALANVRARPLRDRESQEKGFMHRVWQLDAALTRNEVLMTALDNGDPNSPFVKAISIPLANAKHDKYKMVEQLGKEIKDLNASMPKGWEKSIDDVLPNDWFLDPSTGDLMVVTRSDMINIMTHWGNRSNINKFTSGWGSPELGRAATKAERQAFEVKMKSWIDEHATRDDWRFAQKWFDIYEGYRVQSERVYQDVSGTQPKFYDANPIDTSHGVFKGGYMPISRDLNMPNQNIKEAVTQGPFDFNYPNFNTPQGHLKDRTGAVYYVNFRTPLTDIPMRMQQVIHDIAYREPVMNAAKILRDNEVRNTLRRHYGSEYVDTLDDWLLKTARGSSINEKANSARDDFLRKVRLNLMMHALPFNYVVQLTPDLGNFNPRVMMNYWKDWQTNYDTAQRLSKEIPHSIYNIDRDYGEAMAKLVGEGKVDSLRAKGARFGFAAATAITQHVRTAVFIDRFQQAKAEGLSDVLAAEKADTVVREQFGSTAIHDLPSIMTSGEPGRLATVFYGFFNGQYNRMRPIKGMISRSEYMNAAAQTWGTIILGSLLGGLIANPAREEDSYVKRIFKAAPLHLAGQIPFLREGVTMMTEGIPPSTPHGSLLKAGSAAYNDVKAYMQGRPVKSGVKHMANVVGMTLGVPGTLQIGRTGQGLYDLARGKQHPRNMMEYVRLLATGEARLKRQGER